MRATFALLADRQVHNWVRKLAWEIHQKYRTGTQHCRLPPHISLKQPFHISDLPALEAYMDAFAQSVEPFEVTLSDLHLEPIAFGDMEYGVLWLTIQETAYLRHLHLQLNDELSQRFGNTHADYDGSAYQFHMTVMIGGQPIEVYRTIYSELSERSITMRYTVAELGLFVYDEPIGPHGEYLAYKTVPIGG